MNVNDIQARASGAVLDLIGDSSDMMRTQKKIEKKWDPTKKKYVAENNKEKMIKSESGQWIPVSYKSDRYKKWQERNKIINEEENDDDTNDFQKPTSSNYFSFLFIFIVYIIVCISFLLSSYV